jgi:hypothetical protein
VPSARHPRLSSLLVDSGNQLGVCNRWAKNATIGIDRGTPYWLRDDARLDAPNTHGSCWGAADRGNRLVDARRTVVIANGASRQRRGRNGSARCGARNSGTVSIRTARTSSQSPLPKTLTSADDSHERQVPVVCPSSISKCTTRTGRLRVRPSRLTGCLFPIRSRSLRFDLNLILRSRAAADGPPSRYHSPSFASLGVKWVKWVKWVSNQQIRCLAWLEGL